MITIGTFKKTDTGFTGTIRTLTVNVKATLVPNEKRSENAPDYWLLSNSVVEIGAAWQKTAKESERPYLSITFDDPSFSGPIYARLLEADKNSYDLVWTRPDRS